MNEHITADDREILNMLHDVVYKATDKEGDYDEWLLNKHKTIRTLTDILVGLIVNTQSHTALPKQPEQEPVGWLNANEGVDAYAFTWRKKETHDIPLYTAREWVGLEDEELPDGATYEFGSGACWAAAKLKEKNT